MTNDICHIHKFPKILKNPIGTHIKAYGGWVELTNGTYQSHKQIQVQILSKNPMKAFKNPIETRIKA